MDEGGHWYVLIAKMYVLMLKHTCIGNQAEAVNLWIGDSRSTTSLHHDP